MRNQCLGRRAVSCYLQSWQMLCHVESLNEYAVPLSLDPVQAVIIVLEAGTRRWNFVLDCIIIRSSWSLKSRGMCDTRVSEQTVSPRETQPGITEIKSICLDGTLPSCCVLLISQQTHQIRLLHPPCVDFPGIYMKPMTVLKTVKKKSMAPFIFFRWSFASGEN